MIKVFEVTLSDDLQEFAEFLWQHEIPHRILEDDESQSLWVPRHVNVERVRFIYEQWRNGGDLSSIKVKRPLRQRLNPLSFPLTIGLLILSAVITFGIGFGNQNSLMHWLTITDYRLEGQNLIYTHLLESLRSFEIWRFVTPIFMHFNLPHILFNALWIWVIGRRIEQLQGARIFIVVILWSAVVSNIAQFWISGPLFGGLSGVVFAILAYTWLWDKKARVAFFGFPPSLMIFMVFWLVIGYTGLLEAIGFGSIANTAHLAGLIAGLLAVPLIQGIFKRETEL
ncbi:rhomboid family intramembrane serine protease [Neptunomonas japonica]|uniref:Peptidase S54 n=1 Tax=Neptunomonas japonica JAMM 1380 TaxID=1441457 RepID=A0A7R6PAB5_9GAMM|nr:rhomboid family intramembrane serine protease [Neptunomonas japonica]BBB30153.1 peptidase S54 [Neptunomonas japonica JAMM 1380]